MKLEYKLPRLLITMILFITGCQAAVQSQNSSTNDLPLPKTVTDAALVNFRPLTNTGRSIGAAWSPDGQNLAYTELSFAPSLISYRDSNAIPDTQVWETSGNGKDGRMLDIGTALFYSKDGTEIYYQIYDPTNNTPSIYAIDPSTKKTRHFLGTEGFPSVHQLKDDRLVLSEVGNYQPLHFFDPSNGELTTLMEEHPSNAPQDARISPDGKLMAYPDYRAVYLSRPDGSSPRLLSDYGGGGAKVWWSPDSKYLAYTTGSTITDQLLLADRKGNKLATLFPNLGEIGYISAVEWSPDSRWMLVSAEANNQFESPTRTYLFDREGNRQLILESYLSASPAWSPDGRTLALPLWIDPQGDEPIFDVWLADLTDTETAASLEPSSPPTAQPTPTLAAVPLEYSPDQVVGRFWELINQKEYHTAWSMLSKTGRLLQKYPEFRAFYECMQQVSPTNPQVTQSDDDTMIFSMQLSYQRDPECNESWQQSNDIFALLTKPASTEPWQIECLSDTPSCINQEP
jgi:Tol biopolymer transport system component